MKKQNIRHGDVLIKPAKIPAEAKKQDTQNGIVLAEGEVTGHAHRLSANIGALFKYDKKTYLRVTKDRAALTHEEHGKIELPAGDYEVEIQREYKPEGWVKVLD